MDKDPKKISGMFDDISGTYDNLNRIISAGRDIKWRKDAVQYLSLQNKKFSNILDLASGTGDFASELVNIHPQIICSADFSYKMLLINKERNISGNNILCVDAEKLPFHDRSFDLITISFGIRNFNDLQKCMQEAHRILKDDGMITIIEMFRSDDKGLINMLFKFYFNRIVPLVGGLISGKKIAYAYLHKSVANFHSNDDFKKLMHKSGFIIEHETKNFMNIVYTIIFKKYEHISTN